MSECGVVAVIRAPSKELLTDITRALLAGGVISVEVTMSTPDAIAGIEMLARQFDDQALIGVGTVLKPETARDAIAAGAKFVVSPAFDPEVVAVANREKVAVIPGAFTPTEILRAWNGGGDVVKVFPSTALGPGYFKDVLAPLPFLKLTPTGGVTVAVLISTPVVPPGTVPLSDHFPASNWISSTMKPNVTGLPPE